MTRLPSDESTTGVLPVLLQASQRFGAEIETSKQTHLEKKPARSSVTPLTNQIAVVEPPKNEHIFPATKLTELAIRWKELNAKNRHGEAMVLLEEIVSESTAMFERLAQYEDFHRTVDLPILVAAAQEKVVKWLLHWKPSKGKLFTFFSKCAKNSFRSEVVKVTQYRKRFHTTGDDNLEKFYGFDEHDVDKRDAAKTTRSRLAEITSRWGDPQEIGALHFFIECIISDDEHDKQSSIRACSYAYGIPVDLAKFFYTWSLVALRDAMYDQVYVPFTEQDLFRHRFSYTHLPDLLSILTWEQMRLLIATRGGMRFKIPTIAQIAQLKEDYATFLEIDASGKDPDSVALVAKNRKRTPRTAQEAYESMVETLDPNRSGEFQVYDNP